MRFVVPACVLLIGFQALTGAADFPRFRTEEIDPRAGEICYAVTVADVGGDARPDVVAVTEDAVVWYENPGWRKHDVIRGVTVRDNVCIDPYDIDADGRVDFALGARWRPADTANSSTLQWLGRDSQGRWRIHPIGFDDPTLHRLRWGDVMGTKRKQLVIAPLQGRGTKGPDWGAGQGARILVYQIPDQPDDERWPFEIADSSLHTIHNLQLIDLDGDHRDEIVVACWEGVFALHRDPSGTWSKVRLGLGNQETRPFKGASEVKFGRWGDGKVFVATIEPWHGNQVVIYTPPATGPAPTGSWLTRFPTPMARRVIAEPLGWGHAVWCADLDGDRDDELIIGQRDPNRPGQPGPRGPGVFVFDPRSADGELRFDRYTIDDGGMACEDAMAADLDGDGRADIIAGGRATHNVRIYWNQK